MHENTMQRSAWKVHMHFASNTINHCWLMHYSFTSGHRTYHQHTVKNTSSGCILTPQSLLQLHLTNCETDNVSLTYKIHHILHSPMARSSPAGAWAPWEWGSYFTAWHKGHLFTLLCSLALPCEHSQASKRKELLCDTHLTLKSSAASLALSISSMIRAFSSVFFLTWAVNMVQSSFRGLHGGEDTICDVCELYSKIMHALSKGHHPEHPNPSGCRCRSCISYKGSCQSFVLIQSPLLSTKALHNKMDQDFLISYLNIPKCLFAAFRVSKH